MERYASWYVTGVRCGEQLRRALVAQGMVKRWFRGELLSDGVRVRYSHTFRRLPLYEEGFAPTDTFIELETDDAIRAEKLVGYINELLQTKNAEFIRLVSSN